MQSEPKYIFAVVAHVLGVSDFQCLCDLSVYDIGVFTKVVGEFVVDLVVGCSFIYICEVGSNNNNISNNTITTTLIVCVPSSLTIIFVLFYNQSNVHHIDN